MKFSQVDENVLTTLFGKEVVDKLSGALKSDDGELSLGAKINGRVMTPDDEKTIREGAILQGKELRSKEIAKELSIELLPGEKDPKVIAKKFTNTITEIMEVKYKNQKPSEIEEELKTKLKDSETKYDVLSNTHNTILSDYKNLESKIKVKERDNSIMKSFPEKMNMDKGDALLILTNNFEFSEQEGKQIIKRGGEIVRNGAGLPETYENVIKSFVEEKHWIGSGGMNGKDRSGSQHKKGLTAEQAEKAIIESGKDPGSPEGLKMFNGMIQK